MNRPDNWHDQIADYVLGNLSPTEAAELQDQIARDPILAQELAALEDTAAALPYALPNDAPSPGLKRSILEAAEASNLPNSHVPPISAAHGKPPFSSRLKTQNLTTRHRFRMSPLAGAIAASLLLALGIDNYRLRQRVTETASIQQALQSTLQQNQAEIERLQAQVQSVTPVVSSLQEPNSVVYPLNGTGQAEGATARLVAVPGHQNMVLVSENLPRLSDDQIYRLWAIADKAAKDPPHYCGQFRTSTDSTIQWTAPTLTCSEMPDQLLITLDQPTDPIDSAGPLIMQSQI
ncbi:MAG: anti-sigma factor [Cyanobacteria bacterium P01_E01_bin.6]